MELVVSYCFIANGSLLLWMRHWLGFGRYGYEFWPEMKAVSLMFFSRCSFLDYLLLWMILCILARLLTSVSLPRLETRILSFLWGKFRDLGGKQQMRTIQVVFCVTMFITI